MDKQNLVNGKFYSFSQDAKTWEDGVFVGLHGDKCVYATITDKGVTNFTTCESVKPFVKTIPLAEAKILLANMFNLEASNIEIS